MAKNGRKIAAGVGAVSTLAVSGAALASSQTVGASSTPSSPPSSSPSSSSTQAQQGNDAHGPRGMRGLDDKAVTGTAATKVTNAVKAKDASITVKGVRQAPDGSYRAFGTRADERVMVEVSKDLKTVTVRTGMGPGGHGGPGEHGRHGHHRGTEVTGTALTDVKNAVKAKDSGVTVEKVFKESDGTYHAFGTKSGAHVRIDVSKDLKTVTVKSGKPGKPGGHDGPRRDGAQSGQGQGGSGSTSSSTTAPSSSSTRAQAA